MSANFHTYSLWAQNAHNLVVSQLNHIYTTNPYSHKRELSIEPTWLTRHFNAISEGHQKDYVECSYDRKIIYHTWKQPGSGEHFPFEALTNCPTDKAIEDKQNTLSNLVKSASKSTNPSPQMLALIEEMRAQLNQMRKEQEQFYHQNGNASLHAVAHNVFDRIRKYVDQVALESGSSRHQFDYQLKIYESSNDNQYGGVAVYGGKIFLQSSLLKTLDNLPGTGYECLSLEDKVAFIVAHEFAHHCLGHPQSFILVASLTDYLIRLPLNITSWTCYLLGALTFVPSPQAGMLVFNVGIASNLIKKLSEYRHFEYFLRRQGERDADAYAVELLYQAGFDIRSAQFYSQTFKETDSYWWSTSTHPSRAERLKNVTEIVESYHKKHGHYKKP